MSMSWEGSSYEDHRHREYVRRQMESEYRWGIDPYDKPKKKKKSKKPEILQPEDIIIDMTYFKMPGDGKGEGGGNQGNEGETQANSNDFTFDDAQDLVQDYLGEGSPAEDSEEKLIKKLFDMDSIRMNIKRKFRF